MKLESSVARLVEHHRFVISLGQSHDVFSDNTGAMIRFKLIALRPWRGATNEALIEIYSDIDRSDLTSLWCGEAVAREGTSCYWLQPSHDEPLRSVYGWHFWGDKRDDFSFLRMYVDRIEPDNEPGFEQVSVNVAFVSAPSLNIPKLLEVPASHPATTALSTAVGSVTLLDIRQSHLPNHASGITFSTS
jgi:hypothetical protein